MATYVLSDLHGMFDEFIEMLDLIRFSNEDEMIVAGDVFDRGKYPLEILDYIAGRKNIHLIKGNHEQTFIDFYETGDAQVWLLSGGTRTYNQIIKKGYMYSESLYRYLKKLPSYKVVDNNIICHAGLYFPKNYKSLTVEQLLDMQDEETLLWSRSNVGNEKRIEGFNIICGHTPVQSIDNTMNEAHILERNGTYYIDCGCYYKNNNGRLGCLRLEDKKEFYV